MGGTIVSLDALSSSSTGPGSNLVAWDVKAGKIKNLFVLGGSVFPQTIPGNDKDLKITQDPANASFAGN